MPDTPAKPPRFPYLVALLCAVSVGVAAWLWMRYSYAWDARPRDLRSGSMPLWQRDQLCVRVWGVVDSPGQPGVTGSGEPCGVFWVNDPVVQEARCNAILPGPIANRSLGEGRFLGRVQTHKYLVDCTGSRFHPASVGGLVVGAMGVFVFAVYLRTWVKERRAWQRATGGPNTSVARPPSAS